jgi:hypothetical protein
MLTFISSAFLSIAVADCNKKSLSSMVFHDATNLRVRGRAFNATGPEATAYPFERLPASSKGIVRDAVYGLSEQPAGLFVQFESDASCIFVNYTLVSASTSMWHFASTGEAGMDLYAWDDGNATWRWTGTAAPSYPVTTKKVAAAACSSADKCKLRSYRLHLPTYARVRDVQIGINREANVLRSDSTHIDASAKPIVWYGTSILQGAVASRPGQINTHIVSRALSREIYNFGFSGNGLMELSVARYLAPIPASLIIIDCNPNMVASLITNRTKPLVAYLRTHGHATTPIVLSEGTPYGADWTYTAAAASGNAPKNVALKAKYHFQNLVFLLFAALASPALASPAALATPKHHRFGAFDPVFTPFYANGTLNLAAVPGYAKWTTDCGTDTIILGGSTGEWPSMTSTERLATLRAWRTAIDALPPRTPPLSAKPIILVHAGDVAMERASCVRTAP